MGKILNWIKKFLIGILLIIFFVFIIKFLFFNKNYYQPSPFLKNEFSTGQSLEEYRSSLSMKNFLNLPSFSQFGNQYQNQNINLPPTRMTTKNCDLSLLVKNVVKAQNSIIKKTEELGGYLVTSNLKNPQEDASAYLSVRVPAEKMDDALEYFRNLSIKVISENLYSQDITDQYIDNEARLETLMKTKKKFEEIFEKATKIEDILNVQREIISLQDQIDNLKGQQKYSQQKASLALINIYLSTDELSLPYAPSESWRPEVIFKQAVRSLVGVLRKLGTLIIWITVYSVIWAPLLVLFLIFKKRKNMIKNKH